MPFDMYPETRAGRVHRVGDPGIDRPSDAIQVLCRPTEMDLLRLSLGGKRVDLTRDQPLSGKVQEEGRRHATWSGGPQQRRLGMRGLGGAALGSGV